MKTIAAIAQNRKVQITIVLHIVAILLPTLCMAGPDFESEHQDVPIDGGLSLLVAAGAAYGARKALRKNGMVQNKP